MSGGDRFLYVLGALIPAMLLTMPFAWFAQTMMGEAGGAVVGWVLFPVMLYGVYMFSSRRWPPETYPK